MIYVIGFVAFCLLAGLMWLFFTWLWRQLEKRLYRPAGGREAARFLWDYMGHGAEPLPRVYWIKGRTFRAATMGGISVGGVWAAGAVTVAHVPGMLFCESALAHELLHECRFRLTGAIWGSCQQHDAAWYELENAANEVLRRWELAQRPEAQVTDAERLHEEAKS